METPRGPNAEMTLDQMMTLQSKITADVKLSMTQEQFNAFLQDISAMNTVEKRRERILDLQSRYSPDDCKKLAQQLPSLAIVKPAPTQINTVGQNMESQQQ